MPAFYFPNSLHRLALAVCTCAATLSMAQAGDDTREIPVTDKFVDGKLTWSGRPGYEYKWKIQITDGMYEVCGVGVNTSNRSRQASRNVMRRAWVENKEGQKLMRDMRFFTLVKKPGQMATAMATCKSTGQPAPKGNWTVRLKWDPSSARF